MSSKILINSLLIIISTLQGCFSAYVDVMPHEATVLPKQNVTFLCTVGTKIQYCRVQIPGVQTLNLAPESITTNGISYYGQGLEAGQCGVSIRSTEEKHNGDVKCFMGTLTETTETVGTMKLIVAKPPKPPVLDLNRGTDSLQIYRVDDLLQASCIVRDGRPPANISWFLDDEPIVNGLQQPTIIDLAKDDSQSIIQNLTRRLQPTDNGKKLRCVASHPALNEHNRETFRQLDVKYSPLSVQNPIHKFDYELGKPGIITVEVNANPKPRLEWRVGDQVIQEGGLDGSGKLEAEHAKDEGKGKYIATLRIASITKQDTETSFRLTAYNDQGTTEYIVIISTNPEPEGLELDVGYIVGIVVALLLLLFLIFLIVFARATGRWCFSERVPRLTGESSDTESAEVRHKESKLRAPKLNLPAFLKRNKDITEVTVEDETNNPGNVEEQKVPLEDSETTAPKQEGVVYAELDLVAQNLRPLVKSDDDKTEYAEIVYTKNDKDENVQQTENKAT